jgi:hypothetical protein
MSHWVMVSDMQSVLKFIIPMLHLNNENKLLQVVKRLWGK